MTDCNCEACHWLGPQAAKLAEFASRHLDVSNGAVSIKNAKLVVTDHNMQHIVVLGSSHASGWQKPIGIDATVKCIICEEMSVNDLICEECKTAIMFVRGSKSLQAMGDFIDKFPVMAEAVSKGLLQKWIEDQIEEMEETDG